MVCHLRGALLRMRSPAAGQSWKLVRVWEQRRSGSGTEWNEIPGVNKKQNPGRIRLFLVTKMFIFCYRK